MRKKEGLVFVFCLVLLISFASAFWPFTGSSITGNIVVEDSTSHQANGLLPPRTDNPPNDARLSALAIRGSCGDYSVAEPVSAETDDVYNGNTALYGPKNTIDKVDSAGRTYWASKKTNDDTYRFITFDLGSKRCVNGVETFVYGNTNVPENFLIRVSDDKQTWADVGVGYSVNKVGVFVRGKFSPVAARYVQLVGEPNKRGLVTIAWFRASSASYVATNSQPDVPTPPTEPTIPSTAPNNREELSLTSENPSAEVTLSGMKYTIELVSASDTSANIKVTNMAGESETKEVSESTSKEIKSVKVSVTNADETSSRLSAIVIVEATSPPSTAVTYEGMFRMLRNNCKTYTMASGEAEVKRITASGDDVCANKSPGSICILAGRVNADSQGIITGNVFANDCTKPIVQGLLSGRTPQNGWAVCCKADQGSSTPPINQNKINDDCSSLSKETKDLVKYLSGLYKDYFELKDLFVLKEGENVANNLVFIIGRGGDEGVYKAVLGYSNSLSIAKYKVKYENGEIDFYQSKVYDFNLDSDGVSEIKLDSGKTYRIEHNIESNKVLINWEPFDTIDTYNCNF